MKKQVKRTDKRVTTNQLAVLIEKLAEATAKGFEGIHNELQQFKEETRENFAQVRRDILDIRTTYATKEELKKVTIRVETLERKKNN